MSNKYDFASVEPKWQKYWEEHGSFRAKEDHTKPKFYALVEFPYPSGHGMHVGHIKAYSGLEVVSRKRLFVLGQDNRLLLFGIPVPERRICGCPDADEEKNKKKNVQQNSLFVHKSLLN